MKPLPLMFAVSSSLSASGLLDSAQILHYVSQVLTGKFLTVHFSSLLAVEENKVI